MGDAAEDARDIEEFVEGEKEMPPAGATRSRRKAAPVETDAENVEGLTEDRGPWGERRPSVEDATIYQRMVAVIAELPALGKDDYNKAQKFHFRSHDSVMTALNPLLAKHGVFIVPDVVERTTAQRLVGSDKKTMYEVNLHVRFTFWGATGDKVEASAWGEGTDMGDKATNKAMTAAFKYCIVQAFAIASEESADSDRDTPEDTTGRAGNGGRQAAAPKTPAAASWTDWKVRMELLGISAEDSAEWLRQASEGLDTMTEDGKNAVWARANIALIALSEMDTDLAFDPDARSKIQKAFASALGGAIIDGPLWRLSPTEEDRPTYDEYQADLKEQADQEALHADPGPIEDEVLPGTEAAALESPEQAEGFYPDIGF